MIDAGKMDPSDSQAVQRGGDVPSFTACVPQALTHPLLLGEACPPLPGLSVPPPLAKQAPGPNSAPG